MMGHSLADQVSIDLLFQLISFYYFNVLGECLSWNLVCNQEPDCIDSSDEGAECDTSCSIENGQCAQICRNSPRGPVCDCHEGYQLSADRITCDDVDECQHEGQCSHHCENVKGHFKCSCANGYHLTSDHVHCKANGSEGFLFYMLPSQIRSIGFRARSQHTTTTIDSMDMSG